MADPTPTIDSISPTNGAEFLSQTITVYGTNIGEVLQVNFLPGPALDPIPATNIVIGDGTYFTFDCPEMLHGNYQFSAAISATPGGSGSTILYAPGYTYNEATLSITSISPSSGNELTGKRITIFGDGLYDITSVTFAGVPARDIVAVSNTEISCVCPPLRACVAEVVVSDGTSFTSPTDYTYATVATKYHSTMKNLLTNVKDALNQFKVEGGSLDKVQQIKRGILPPKPSFPTICILPQALYPIKKFSGQRVDMIAGFKLIVYTKLIDDSKAQNQCIEICEEVKEILNFLHPIQASAFRLSIGNMELTQVEGNTGLVRRGEILFTVNTKRTLPTPTESAWTETSSDDLLDTVFTTIKTYASTTLASVNSRGFLKRTERPKMVFPNLNVIVQDNVIARDYRGIDAADKSITINVANRLVGKEEALDVCLDIGEAVMDVVWENCYWAGAAWDSDLESVTYGTGDYGEKTLTYEIELVFGVLSREVVNKNQQ